MLNDSTLEPAALGRRKSPEPGSVMSIRIPTRLRDILLILADTNRRARSVISSTLSC